MKEDFPSLELVDVAEDLALSANEIRVESELGVVKLVLDTLAELHALLTAKK